MMASWNLHDAVTIPATDGFPSLEVCLDRGQTQDRANLCSCLACELAAVWPTRGS